MEPSKIRVTLAGLLLVVMSNTYTAYTVATIENTRGREARPVLSSEVRGCRDPEFERIAKEVSIRLELEIETLLLFNSKTPTEYNNIVRLLDRLHFFNGMAGKTEREKCDNIQAAYRELLRYSSIHLLKENKYGN